MFNRGDMQDRRERALQRVHAAIEAHGGTTLLSTGITGDDARMARAAVAGGARMLEPNHPAVAMRCGLRGVRTMHEAEAVRHEVTNQMMADVVHGVREAVGPEIVITVGIPGGFTELQPVVVTDEDFKRIALAGADGLHTHKADLGDLAEWVERAHAWGLFVDAYIAHPQDRHRFGIPADKPSDVAATVARMKGIGVDLVGLMTGLSYEGVSAGEIPASIHDRLLAMIESAGDMPTIAEGGINLANWQAVKALGVNIVVVGTALDDIAARAVTDTVGLFLPARP
jgi:imidazole glycerol-phosphate synthase subunit HisF